jgi:hypothetical protein
MTTRSTNLLIDDPHHPGRLVPKPKRAWLGPLAHLLGWSLDRQLATGRPPEASRLLTTRAQWLVSPQTLMQLARNWEAVREQARRPPTPRDPRMPVCRDRVIAAGPDIERLLRALAAPCPKPVRGTAMASSILSDAAGPLYNPGSAIELQTALHEAISQLDPWLPLELAIDRDEASTQF